MAGAPVKDDPRFKVLICLGTVIFRLASPAATAAAPPQEPGGEFSRTISQTVADRK